jgi:hypothetical protein
MIPESAKRTTVLKAALTYAGRGVPVFPCAPAGKVPLTTHGFYDATTDLRKIHAWWNRWPEANIGIPTGSMSGPVVVDLDEATPEASRIWDSLPPTVEVATRRGLHCYYRVGTDTQVRGLYPVIAVGPDVVLPQAV